MSAVIMPAVIIRANVVEERWTPATIHANFALRDLPSTSRDIVAGSVPLPLPSLGWAFALSLSLVPQRIRHNNAKWIPTAFSFCQHDRKIPWGNASMHAQLSCGDAPYDNNSIGSDSTSLGTIDVKLAHTPSAEVPLSTSYTLLLHRSTKVWLTVTIQQCPFTKGLFQARSHHGSEAEVQTQVRQIDRVLSRSLTTGKHFDVQFLSCPTRSTPGNPASGKLLPTYASLSVLEKHINFPDGGLKDEWASALAALNDHDTSNADSKLLKEISFPDNDEYELLDSDYEDEDEDPSPAVPCERDLPVVVTLDAKTPENNIERSWSPVELDGASDQDPVDNDRNKGLGGPSHSFSGATVDRDRTVSVKFAAHRTWHAFLWYCYTGQVEFSRLKSQVEPGVQRIPLTHLMDGPPSCSPKSMYRLAHLVGNDDLKAKALEAIKDRMSEVNVLDETFSVFTSRYPDVREVQLSALMKHCRSPEVKKMFIKMMQKFSNMPHAEPVLSAFYDQLVA